MISDIPRYGDKLVITDAATIEFHQFLEDLSREINDILDGTTVLGGGSWVRLDTTTVTGSPANYEYTWDETLYSDIRVVYTGIQPATDTVSFYVIVGHTDGGTMFNSASDYDGNEREMTSTTWSALADTDKVRIGPNFSNAANETASGTIEIIAGGDANTGCIIESRSHYLDAASNQRTWKVEAFLDDGNVGAIDTVRLYFASGNLANVGTVQVYGLTI